MKDWSEVQEPLAERIGRGFGGVSEYGITVRWDKNFLFLIYLTLVRRQGIRIFGGIRFGGTLTLEDASELGFDHVAIATGAGKPTVVDMKNNLIRGIRKASDFLMALQLTGAARGSSLANLQVQLPAVVIGGGLTAIDTATELFHYYPVMVERIAGPPRRSCGASGRLEAFEKRLDPEEKALLARYREHAAAFRAERARAAAAGETPDFIPLVRSFGGVTIAYRKSMQDSPAYRLNHEEVIKSLEEGIAFAENLSPVEAVPDELGAVKAMRFERQALKDGKWIATGEIVELPARSVMVAAGTSPNTIYEREHPGTFAKQPKGGFFQPYQAAFENGQVALKEGPARDSFFASYQKDGLTVSFYGDNHPRTRATSSRRWRRRFKGYGQHRRAVRIADPEPRPAGQPVRDRNFRELCARLDDELRCRVVRVEPPHADDHRGHRAGAVPGAEVPARPVLPAAEPRDAGAGRRRHPARDGRPRAHRRVGRPEEGPPLADHPRDGRLVEPLRDPQARPGSHLHGPDGHADRDPARRGRAARGRRPRQRRALLDREGAARGAAAACSTSPATRTAATSSSRTRSRPRPTRSSARPTRAPRSRRAGRRTATSAATSSRR